MFGKSISYTLFLTSIFLLNACGEGASGPGIGSSGNVAEIINNKPNYTCDKSNSEFKLPGGYTPGTLDYITISQDLEIGPGCYYAADDVVVNNGAQLTIRPNTILEFSAGKSLKIKDGNIKAIGTSSQPIYFTAEIKTTNTAWNGIQILNRSPFFNSNTFSYTVIEYGGAAPRNTDGGANISITDTGADTGNPNTRRKVSDIKPRTYFSNNVIRYSAGEYALLADEYTFFDKIENNIFYGNLRYPLSVDVNESFKINKSNQFSYNDEGNRINKLVISGITLNTLQHIESQPTNLEPGELPIFDITWSNLGIPYLIKQKITIASTVLNIEPGTILEFENDSGLSIEGESAALVSKGNPDQIITMTDADVTDNQRWKGLTFTNTHNPKNTLEYTNIIWAGAPRGKGDAGSNSNIAIVNSSIVNIRNSLISNSLGYGLFLDDTSNLPEFENNQLLENQSGIAEVSTRTVHFLLTGNTYGNTFGNTISDTINLIPDQLNTNHSIQNLGVPFILRKSLEINGDVTIEPGTTLLFEENTQLLIKKDGTLNAQGNVFSPILFSDLSQLNEDFSNIRKYWRGISFTGSTDPNRHNNFSYVTIDHAGLNQAPITLINDSYLSINNSIIQNSYPNGGNSVEVFDTSIFNNNGTNNF